MPTAAKLNLYLRWNSCVGWLRDDETLFGECGEAKLIVPVSFGSSAVFKWKGRSCPDDEGHLCWLGHGDILVIGQCQDKFLHRTDPGREQERINVTFRWIKQHALSCALFKAGVACCLPTCAQGSSVPVTGDVGNCVFLGFLASLWCLVHMMVLALLVYNFCTRLGSHRCASCWTRTLGGGRCGHYLCDLWGGNAWQLIKTAKNYSGTRGSLIKGKPYLLSLAGQPSLLGYYACMVYWNQGALRRNCGQIHLTRHFSHALLHTIRCAYSLHVSRRATQCVCVATTHTILMPSTMCV